MNVFREYRRKGENNQSAEDYQLPDEQEGNAPGTINVNDALGVAAEPDGAVKVMIERPA